MANKKWDVLGIGICAVDELIYLDHYPIPDTKFQILGTHRQGGGLTATALAAAARLGAKAAYCCLLGFNELSEFTVAELEKEGVDCSPCVRREDGLPYLSFILVDQAEHTRTILYNHGNIEPPLEAITTELIEGCKVLFVDNFVPAAGLRAAEIARRAGIPVVADLESFDFKEFDRFQALIDHLIVGISLASRMTGRENPAEAVIALARVDRACTVVTAGKGGCWYSVRGGLPQHFPAFTVPVTDTTGCGDVFHGAYAASLARGEPIEKAVQIASVAAAIKAGKPGGRCGIPDLATIFRFLKEREIG